MLQHSAHISGTCLPAHFPKLISAHWWWLTNPCPRPEAAAATTRLPAYQECTARSTPGGWVWECGCPMTGLGAPTLCGSCKKQKISLSKPHQPPGRAASLPLSMSVNIYQPSCSPFRSSNTHKKGGRRTEAISPPTPFNQTELNVNTLYGLATSSSLKAALKSPNHFKLSWLQLLRWVLKFIMGQREGKGTAIQKYLHLGWKTWSSPSHANSEPPASVTADRAQACLLKCPRARRETELEYK